VYLAVRDALSFAHPRRRFSLIRENDFEFKEVNFKSRDGLTLFGNFFPARNHATILLVHGLGASGKDLAAFARLFIMAGYGVLLMDLRAHGKSEGDTSTFGLREGDDVAGAVDYLLTRIDVHGDRIGAYGISLGAQAVLRGALKTDKIRALALEGLGPSVLSDHGGVPQTLARWINYPFNWLYYIVYHFMIGGRDKGVLEVIGEVAPRPILFIASGGRDIYFGRLFHQAAKEPKELWEIPNSGHGAAFMHDPQEYKQRILGFFNRELNV
jgi:pimeloyl-ACP methyl ester carboxylesterase